MKRITAVLLALVLSLAWAHSQTGEVSYRPKHGYVPDSQTAVRIAEAVLIPVYGEKKILAERPFNTTLAGNVWQVDGTLHCPNQAVHCDGGTARVKISKNSREILQVIHFK